MSSLHRYLRKSSYLVATVSALAPASLPAQPGGDTLAMLEAVHRRLAALGPDVGPRVWPGFRPDTVPVAFALRGRGTLLLGWPGAPPAGFEPVAGRAGAAWLTSGSRSAASTGAELGGRHVAQAVVGGEGEAALVGLAAHEAFHVFQAASRRPGRRFGRGEQSMLVSDYPALDVENEADFALEAALLARALSSSEADARVLAREWLAVREARHRRMSAALAEFETAAELNEGLAEYALLRFQGAAEGADGVPADLPRRLSNAVDAGRSPRLRFYATGAAQAYLLDRLAGDGWKTRLVADDLTLQEMLARAAGYRETEDALRRSAAARLDGGALRARAARQVEGLRALRQAQVDSARARPGILLRVDAGRVGGVGSCGFDPQNLVRVSESVLLHTRWLRPCAGAALEGELTAWIVEDRDRATLEAVIGPEADVRLTIGGAAVALADGERREGAQVRIESPAATLTSARAVLERRGRELVLTPLP
jgi:hypothetical protein